VSNPAEADQPLPHELVTEVMAHLDTLNRITSEDFHRFKIGLSKKYSLPKVPPNSQILAALPQDYRTRWTRLLRKKPSRTVSGVAPVAVMTSPAPCPHGRCRFCPGGPDSGTPQSYTGKEPAALRGAQHDFDPARQVMSRIEQLEAMGHSAEKVDLIVMGGTFPAREVDYQTNFLLGCFNALNGEASSTLEQAHLLNERARYRCIGLTLETRPDCVCPETVERMLSQGVTRIELGVQLLDDDILASVERGHGVDAVVEATRLLKDAGMKVCYHLMPGLPGVTAERDLKLFSRVFDESPFRPDMIKIYPMLVMEGTEIYRDWVDGRVEPLYEEEAVEMVARMKERVPRWVRIQRIERDIPSHCIGAGITKSNLRQMARDRLVENDGHCNCIRCRESGRSQDDGSERGKYRLEETTYKASGGTEVFIEALRGTDRLMGYCRLRFHTHITGEDRATVRELKVVGRAVPLNRREDRTQQHRGMGSALLARAEELSKDRGVQRLHVLSGVGVRSYYTDRGYTRVGPFMIKSL